MSAQLKETEEQQLVKIQEYTQTALALADLSARYKDVVFDASTTKGMAAAKEARAEIRGYRTSLEKLRAKIKEPALERCRLIDSEAKQIKEALEALEDPIDGQIKAEEQRKEAERVAKEKAEAERVSGIQQRIIEIRHLPVRAHQQGYSSSQIKDMIEELEDFTVNEPTFQDFLEVAIIAKQETLESLRHMHAAQKAREDERAELERLRAEQEEQRREEAARKAEADRLEAEQREKDREELAAERENLARERAEHEARVKAEQDRMAAEQRAVDAAKAEADRKLAEEVAEAERRMLAIKAAEEKAAREQQEREQAEAERKAKAEQIQKELEERAKLRAELEPDFVLLRNFAVALDASAEEVNGLMHPIAKQFAATVIESVKETITSINTWIGEDQ